MLYLLSLIIIKVHFLNCLNGLNSLDWDNNLVVIIKKNKLNMK